MLTDRLKETFEVEQGSLKTLASPVTRLCRTNGFLSSGEVTIVSCTYYLIIILFKE